MNLINISQLLREFKLSRFQRELSKMWIVLFLLVYAAMYLNMQSFATIDFLPSLLIAAGCTTALCFLVAFIIAWSEILARRNLHIPSHFYFIPLFFTLSALIACPIFNFSIDLVLGIFYAVSGIAYGGLFILILASRKFEKRDTKTAVETKDASDKKAKDKS